jgi:hypothetical protein
VLIIQQALKVLKTDRVKLTGWLCSGWDSSLLKYEGEGFLDELSSVRFLIKRWRVSSSLKTKYLPYGQH